MPREGLRLLLVDRRVRDLLVGIQENNAYLMGLILWLGFVPAVGGIRRVARPSLRRLGVDLLEEGQALVDSFVAFSYTPLRVASLLGFLVVCLAVGYGALVLYLKLSRGSPWVDGLP